MTDDLIGERGNLFSSDGMSDRLFQITAPHFCAGIVVADGRIVIAAPILRRTANGRLFSWFEAYCKTRHWDIREVQHPQIT
jgi:hypothetical protein